MVRHEIRKSDECGHDYHICFCNPNELHDEISRLERYNPGWHFYHCEVEMKDLPIRRELNDDTRKQGILIRGQVYSLHISGEEVIITDNKDYTKIYGVQSLDFYNEQAC